ncbi:MAG: hypothetical protein HY735_24160 [Verrucomicrobia bacterium]|nr:hypothetical protein [Verrucomicrobiota bacterium]
MTDVDRLLDDILEDVISPPLRAELMDRTLKEARRWKRVRRVRDGLSVAALALGVLGIVWRQSGPVSRVGGAPPSSFRIVRSEPLPSSMIVRSKAGSISVVTSSPGFVVVVESAQQSGLFKEVDDQELLALVEGHPAVLVRHGPREAELVFLSEPNDVGSQMH